MVIILFILIMPISRENVDIDFCLEDSVDETVFTGDAATPAVLGVTFERFWFASASGRMVN